MSGALAGRTVALAEGRQLEELAGLLEKEGATALRCPLVSILDTPDEGPVLAWLRDLIAGQFRLVILLTGEGLRRLLGFAERAGQRDAVIAALAKTQTLTRGPKPAKALKEIGLTPALSAAMPTTEGVIATLRGIDVAGQTIGLQLYSESNAPLTDYLASAGASVRSVQPYIYAPAADADHVVNLIEQLAGGTVDVLLITSSPQVDRLFEVAVDRGLEALLHRGLSQVRVAAVGPIAADSLRRRSVRVDVCPAQGFVMKNLVQCLKRDLGSE
jgi:uroporphyrinogen-III synthase